MKLTFTNKITHKSYDYDVTDMADSGMFWHFKLSLDSGFDDGEYEYLLYDENNALVASGVAQIGNYKAESVSSYTKTEKETYIQYKGSI